MAHTVLSPDKLPVMKKHLIYAWLKTILGYTMMGGLVALAFYGFGATYKFQIGFGLLWYLMPLVMWWFSAKVAILITKSKPADPSDPDHARLLAIVDKVYPKSGLKYKPPVYVSDNPLPNAFATGPIHRKAVVAATRGLFKTGMTDEEIEGVFAHELAHVKNYDVAINSFLSVLSMLFFSIVDAGTRMLLGTLSWFKKTLGMKQQGFFTGILEWIIMFIIFRITGVFTRIIQAFVVRSRESAADATGAMMTLEPCHLATALEKLVAYVEKNRPKGRDQEMYRALRPMMTIDPIFDSLAPESKPRNLWQWLVRMWKRLQLTHPPVPARVKVLEEMNGGVCPRETD